MNQRLSFTVSLLGHLGFKSTAGQQAPSLALATLAGAKTNKSKSVKELAEPEAKRPPSAYNLFIKASIPGLKGQASPGKSLFSQAASAWAALPPEKKKAFETESQALKSIADAKKDHGKAKEDKKPLSHYTLFVQQRYPAVAAKNPTLKPKEIMALVAGEWKAVPEAEKKDRKSAADALKQAYLSKHPS